MIKKDRIPTDESFLNPVQLPLETPQPIFPCLSQFYPEWNA